MRTLVLPGTDLEISQICLGTAEFGLKTDDEQAFRLMDTFVGGGGNFLDTAHCYSDWAPGEVSRSEKLIGRWLKLRSNRSRMVLATKGGIDFRTAGGTRISLAEDELEADIRESLDFLQTDYIDLYWLHRDEPSRSVAEIIHTLNKHVSAGRIRYIGCSNWSPSRIAEANAYARAHGLRPFVANQLEWSLARMFMPEEPLDRSLPFMDREAMEFHRATHLPAIAFSSQAHGFFTIMDKVGEKGLSAHLRKHFLNDRNRVTCQNLKHLSARTGLGVTALSLGYISSQAEFVGVPIIFTSRMEHLLDSLSGADVRLTPDQMAFLAAQTQV